MAVSQRIGNQWRKKVAMTGRAILHCDINCCYAQIECQAHPELRGVPLVVGGDEEARHGIVLARNLLAKAAGIKTADTLVEARRKCPGLVVVRPDYRMYMRASGLARTIYYDYSDRVEPFGPDEAWLDVGGSCGCLGLTPLQMAEEISERMKAELGLTISVGVSDNKIYAKFGSDWKKPDAVTVVDEEFAREHLLTAPVRELLYVGEATERKLRSSGILTIGDLACASDALLKRRLGKMGLVLKMFARGEDSSEVKRLDPGRNDVCREVKSYGNGITFPRDIADAATAKAVTWMLSEAVAQRMREGGARARTVAVAVRDAGTLASSGRQMTLRTPTNITSEVAGTAWSLMEQVRTFSPDAPVRGLHVRASNLVPTNEDIQLSLFDPFPRRAEMEALDAAVDDLRRRFGNNAVVWGPKASCPDTLVMDAKRDNTVHPVSFFHR